VDPLPARSTDVDIHPEPFDSEGAQSVVTQAEGELTARYGFLDAGEQGLTSAQFDPPQGLFLVARPIGGGPPVGGVGLRCAIGTIGEVKRLWVHSWWRGHGIARSLMRDLEAGAREAGYTSLRLGTGPLQPEAIGLYAALGWVRQRHGWDGDPLPPGSIHFAKDISLA